MGNANPDIKVVKVGVRELRNVFIYPLSMNDQFILISKLADAIQSLSTGNKFNLQNNTEAIDFIRTLITENLEQILVFVTDETERPSMNEITNNQLYEIVDVVFSVNFEGMVKNFKDLFQRAKGVIAQDHTVN